MGTVYDRNKSKPDKGPNLWIKYKDPGGKWQYRAVGHINPAGLSKAQVRAKKKELGRLAKDVLTKIEGDVVAGKYGLEDESGQQAEEPTFKEIAEPWAERRLETHADGRHDVGRMRNHLTPFFGPYRLSELDGNTGLVKRYIETKEREKDPKKKIGKATLQRPLALLSRFFNDYSEDGMSMRNPVSMLDRATRCRARSDHDPRMTPFLKRKKDIRRVFLALPQATQTYQPYRIMFAVGAFAGLRTGEVLALDWERDIDLRARRIHVQYQIKEGRKERLKDKESRVVPILDPLLPVLRDWRLVTGGSGLCFPPSQAAVEDRGGRPGTAGPTPSTTT